MSGETPRGRFGGLFGRSDEKWVCARLASGRSCPMGPDRRGRCQATFECAPAEIDGKWRCRRSASLGGPCEHGAEADGTCSRPIERCRPRRSLRSIRASVALWSSALAVAAFVLALTYGGVARVLLPGAIHAAHAPIEDCSICHTNVEAGRFGWLQAVFKPSSKRRDSEACVSCHNLASAPLGAHNHPVDQLAELTEEKAKRRANAETPWSHAIANVAFPADSALEDGVFCATCHKEHRGEHADLSEMPAARCSGCHQVQFAGFEDGHPDFDGYPFKRRTRINFDHASHFGEHFEKSRTQNDPVEDVPENCAGCHALSADKRNMDVKPFETVCAGCHAHQIAGTERLSGPQGIAFLALPGLDVETLEAAGHDIGQWPAASEAAITPFLAMLLGWDADRRKVLERLAGLDLLDLREATQGELLAVSWFAWETKTLFYALSTVKPGMVLRRFAPDRKDASGMLSRLSGGLSRDVVAGAVREWMPDVVQEMAAQQPIELASVIAALDAAETAPPIVNTDEDSGTEQAEANPSDEAADILEEDDAGDDILDGDLDEEDDILADEDLATEGVEEDEGAAEDGEAEEPATPVNPFAADAQAWAEFGGWYRQDFTILYKPRGHADGFFRAWLDHSAKRATAASRNVFSALTHDNAQGQCIKCHSVDMAEGDAVRMNWGTATSQHKRTARFTRFRHEPHFGFLESGEGCLTCHSLDRSADYQKGFEDFDPSTFASNFKPVEKSLCADCHTAEAANDNCLTCHAYHVDGVHTPLMTTRVPK